jgi:hypothetical protein
LESLPVGFSNTGLRQRLAPLLGLAPDQIKPGAMTYHLRRLRLPRASRAFPTPIDTGWPLSAFVPFFSYPHLRSSSPARARIGNATAFPTAVALLRRSFEKVSRELIDGFRMSVWPPKHLTQSVPVSNLETSREAESPKKDCHFKD